MHAVRRLGRCEAIDFRIPGHYLSDLPVGIQHKHARFREQAFRSSLIVSDLRRGTLNGYNFQADRPVS